MKIGITQTFPQWVKIIYNPPYNTGNDFIYADDFMHSQAEENEQMGMYDENRNRLFKNTDTNGKFHSDWCSMIYSRLIISRGLLTDDGVIFISIDENEVNDFTLYDKHQQLLNCAKKKTVSSDDLEHSKNLVRYEIQLKRPYLKEFERENGLSRMKFKNHLLLHYFRKISDEIPTILREAAEPFGKDAWYSASGAMEAVQKSDLKEKTKALVSEYIESLDDLEALANIRHKKKIMRTLNDLEINPVIIPESILNDRQMVRFPCKSLYSRVQEL